MELGRARSVRVGAAGWRRVLLCLGVTGSAAVAVGLLLGKLFTQSDSTHYLNLAAGKPAMLPFASRQLAPAIVRGLGGLGLTVEQGFFALGLVSLACFAAAVAWLLVRFEAPGWTLWAVMGLGFWAQQFNGLVLPDLFYGALVCGFLLLLWRRWMLAACFMLLPLAVAREATALLLLCLLVAGWKLLRWREIAIAIASTVAGFAIVKHLSATALANQEHISPAFYMIAKMPWNLLKNLGLSPWANVYPACPVPVRHFELHVGRLTDIGYCGFQGEMPLRLLGAALVSFGLLPLVLWKIRGVLFKDAGPASLMLRFCVVYGLVSFLMAGVLGDKVLRLFEYGWPVFLIAVPFFVQATGYKFASEWRMRTWLGLHLGLSWSGLWLGGWELPGLGAAAFFAGWWLMRGEAKDEAQGAPGFRDGR